MVQRAPVRPVSPVVHALLMRELDGKARRITLTEKPLRIGRAPDNDLVLASPEVSRHHCTIAASGDAAQVSDQHSTNGVHVDGSRIDGAAQLLSGNKLGIGPFTLTYQRGTVAELAQAEDEAREQARAVAYIQALLPPPLRDGPVRAEWRFVPSAQLGGDAFGYRALDENRLAIFLLDVSGHGVGSALLAASAANMLRAQRLGVDAAEPPAVLQALNACFQMDDHNGLYFSIWYGVYDQATRVLRYGSAGQHPAYLALGGKLAPLSTRAPAIGMSPLAGFTMGEVSVRQGCRLYLFSDGAFEVTRADGTQAGLDDLLPLLIAEGPAAAEPDRIFEAIRELSGRRPFDDDVSLLVLEFQ